MLIKHNVYFSAYDEDGEERLYSTTEVMDEQDYIERLYAEAEEGEAPKKDYTGLKRTGVGAGIGLGAAGLTAGGIYGLPYAEEKLAAMRAKTRAKLVDEIAKATDAAKKEKLQKKLTKMGEAGKIKSAAHWVAGKARGAKNWIAGGNGSKSHKLAAAGIALGTTALGAAGGYGVHKLRSRKNTED